MLEKRNFIKYGLTGLIPLAFSQRLLADSHVPGGDVQSLKNVLAVQQARLDELRKKLGYLIAPANSQLPAHDPKNPYKFGLPGQTQGGPVPPGYVGETLSAISQASSTRLPGWQDSDLALTLPPGVWLITTSGAGFNHADSMQGYAGLSLNLRLQAGPTTIASALEASSYIIGGAWGVARDVRQQDTTFALNAPFSTQTAVQVKLQYYYSVIGSVVNPTVGIRAESRIHAVRIA